MTLLLNRLSFSFFFYFFIFLFYLFIFFKTKTIATCFIKQNLTIQIIEARESSNHTCSKSHKAFVPSRTCEALLQLVGIKV
jgi:hypothetical protein